jgi:hypothetical protein
MSTPSVASGTLPAGTADGGSPRPSWKRIAPVANQNGFAVKTWTDPHPNRWSAAPQ